MPLTDLVEAAVRAPSSHNTQPWLFELGEDRIDLIADRRRALPVNDPYDRELTISCGAALFNLRVAAEAEKMATDVSLLPDPERPDLLARVTLHSAPNAEHPLSELAPAIEKRHTTREAFADRPVDAALLQRMVRAAAIEGARFVVSEGRLSSVLATLVHEGDRAQFENSSWRRELASWMHPRRRGDGLAMSPIVAPISRLVVRNFDLGARTGAADKKLALDAPLLAVFTSEGDEVRDWLRVGQALERTLLVAAGEGVHAGYLNQPCQLPTLRSRLREALPDDEFPQLVVRFGHPEAGATEGAPRRNVDEVLL